MPNPTGAGFFGKLPGVGDFVQRRLPPRFVDRWDQHFERAVDAARNALGNDWQAAYHASPIWHFAMPAGVCGDSAWVGVMGPASDRVGRRFPMLIAAPLVSHEAVTQALLQGGRWFDAVARVHAQAQADPSIHAEAFDAQVAALPGPLDGAAIAAPQPPQPLDWRSASHWRFPLAADGAAQLAGLWSQLAAAGDWCLWWTAGAARVPPSLLATRGLPQPNAYAAFLDAAQARAPWQSAGAFSTYGDAETTQNRRITAPAQDSHAAAAALSSPVPRTLLPDDLSELFADLALAPAAAFADVDTGMHAMPEGGAHAHGEDAGLTLIAADDGAPDPRRRAASAARALLTESDGTAPAGSLAALRDRLLALHPSLQQRRGDLIDPVPENGAVAAAQLTGQHASVLRIGNAGAWLAGNGQLRALFTAGEREPDDENRGHGGEFDDLLFGSVALAAPGLGAAAQPVCEEAVCVVAPGDRLLLLATQALVQLPPELLLEALALPSVDDARARIAAAAGFRSQPAHWPLAIIEITP